MSVANRPGRGAGLHLSLVEGTDHSSWAERRPAVLRVCAGEATLLSEDEVDFVRLVNNAAALDGLLVDDTEDPDEYHLAEVLMEHFCHVYGITRHAKGDRLLSLVSAYRRYLIPFLVELAASRPHGHAGVSSLRITHLQALPQVLAGDKQLPAATVAGDHLKRTGVACPYLSRADAALVTVGGRRALDVAIAAGDLPVHRDVRTGEAIGRPADLRDAGLLLEPRMAHGLEQGTARNVLRDLKAAIDRARDHGARIRGKYELKPIEPLAARRLRQKREQPEGYISLAAIAATNAHMRVVGQAVLWLGRLCGERISEIYGLHVTDFVRDETGRPWLVINKQGGISSLGRDPKTGLFRRQDEKDHTKTSAGVRTIPIPRQLAELLDHLIAIFHTDAETGDVHWSARLVPGLQGDDVSGQSTFRGWLKEAQAKTGVAFRPHTLRAALITDLKNAGVDERTAHYYCGHEKPNATIQDQHYDLGPFPELLHPIADLLERQVTEQLSSDDLRAPVPPMLKEQWGRGTRRFQQASWIEHQLMESGWWRERDDLPSAGRLLDSSQIAEILGVTAATARKLMREGSIPAQARRWGQRLVWIAYEADVQAFKDARGGTTVQEAASEHGMSYHQMWHLLRELDLIAPNRGKGSGIRLTADQLETVSAEIARRDSVHETAVMITMAAQILDMQVVTVETLIRTGELQVVDAPDNTRHRYVTTASIVEYNRRYPPGSTSGPSVDQPPALTWGDAKRLLGVTRPALSAMVRSRQVLGASKPGSRHLYIDAASAIDWAERHNLASVAADIRAHIEADR